MVVKYSSSSSSSAALGLVAVLSLLATAAVTATDHYDENTLYSGQRLRVNEALRWGSYKLIMQTDCNLCLYNNGKGEWCSRTNGNGNDCSLFMQRDGKLVVYNNGYAGVWVTSNALPRGDYVLLLREDGIFAVYSNILWSTRKHGPPIGLQQMPSISLLTSSYAAAAVGAPPANARYDQNVLYEGERLTTNQELTAKSYRFIMQADCNLVLYDAFTSLWVSGTNGKGTGCYLQLLKDGNLVIYDDGDKALWQSGTSKGTGDYVLILKNNGNVALYRKALWSHKPIPDLTGGSTQQLIVNTTTAPRSSALRPGPAERPLKYY